MVENSGQIKKTEMANAIVAVAQAEIEDDRAIVEAGYRPMLRRSLGFFSSFAISFSYMSVLTGIFANYGFVLQKAGPFGCWTWGLVAIGHTLVALVFAEMAGRMPLAGCGYNWNSKLVNPAVGWFAGWMSLFAYAVGVAAVTATIFTALRALLDFSVDSNVARVLGVLLVIMQALINIYGVRIAAYLNLVAVGAEIVGLALFGLAIGAVAIINGNANYTLLTTVPAEPKPYLHGFLMASLLGVWTLLGFEGSADIGEETINVKHVAPRGIIHSVLSCSLLGFAFLALMTLAVTNVPSLMASTSPVATIVESKLGHIWAKIFLGLVIVSMFACSLVNMTGASRVLFAMARDRHFIASSHFQAVSRHRVPSAAVWFVTTVAAFFVWNFESATALYGAGAVLFLLFYLTTVISFAIGFRKLAPTDGFSLGRWHPLVVAVAVCTLVIEICILTVPEEFHSVTTATAAILFLGLILYSMIRTWKTSKAT